MTCCTIRFLSCSTSVVTCTIIEILEDMYIINDLFKYYGVLFGVCCDFAYQSEIVVRKLGRPGISCAMMIPHTTPTRTQNIFNRLFEIYIVILHTCKRCRHVPRKQRHFFFFRLFGPVPVGGRTWFYSGPYRHNVFVNTWEWYGLAHPNANHHPEKELEHFYCKKPTK